MWWLAIERAADGVPLDGLAPAVAAVASWVHDLDARVLDGGGDGAGPSANGDGGGLSRLMALLDGLSPATLADARARNAAALERAERLLRDLETLAALRRRVVP